MNATGPGTVLRPLGIGEVLDRAVNLCVRNFVPLGLIYVIFVLPLSIVQFYATKDFSTLLQGLVDATKSGNAQASSEVLRKFGAGSSGLNFWALALYAITLLVGPLPAAALIAAVAALYLNRTTSLGSAYRIGLARWGQLLGVSLMYLFVAGFLYLVAVLALVAVFFAVGVIYSVSSPAGIAIGVVVGIVAAIVGIAVVTLAVLATQMSYLTCVIENLNFVISFTRGISRIFSGVGLRRSLPFGLAYVAIFAGIALAGGVGEVFLTGLLHSAAAGVAYGAVVRVITAAFTTAFLVIFYYDLRVREEGLDLQMLAEDARNEPLPSP